MALQPVISKPKADPPDWTKGQLRKRYKCVRREAHATSEGAAETAMAAILAASGLIKTTDIIAVYAAIDTEIDPVKVIAGLPNPVALPVVAAPNRPLVFRRWQPKAPMRPGAMGIPEPLPTAATVEPDVLLVPSLAVDEAGYRLGYGGGYYDRTLAELRASRACLAMAVVYEEQRVATLPRDVYDQPVDWILSPNGLIKAMCAP
jgi:5-formyltetrahydrofolate cyclo-ligase